MRCFLVVLFAFFTTVATAQNNAVPPMDKSPMDMSYYPVDYPILRIQNRVQEPLVMRVIYSRPHLGGRKIFGALQDYGEVWRLGANEATEIDFYKDVKINNQRVKKGRYTMYAIPYPDKWIFILNKETDIWGSFKYDSAKDVLRMVLPAVKNQLTENMTIQFVKSGAGADMVMMWDDIKAVLPIVF